MVIIPKARIRKFELTLTLDVDLVRPVHHNIRHCLIAQKIGADRRLLDAARRQLATWIERYGEGAPPRALGEWREIMDRSAKLHDSLVAEGLRDVAPYAVVMAYRIRFYMDMNAREAMHVIELRTAPQGHPAYRRVCQLMHKAIADEAGHRAIAAALAYAAHADVELERLQSERHLEAKRRQTNPPFDPPFNP